MLKRLERKNANLHVESNHLSSVHPTAEWLVVRGGYSSCLWIYPQQILLRESKIMILSSERVEQ